MNKLSVKDVKVKGKRVVVRVDYNVPLNDGIITDNKRIVATLPTIKYLLEMGAKKIILLSHLGRPNGEINKALSLRVVADELEKCIGKPIKFIPDCVGDQVEKECLECHEEIVLLENLRFHIEEEGKKTLKSGEKEEATDKDVAQFRKSLSSLGQVFVNDAFGTVHRAHSSIVGIAIEPKVAGLLVEKELEFFSKMLDEKNKISVAVLGGAKVNDKIQLIENLLERVENLVIGGGMAFTFLSVLKNLPIGRSSYDEEGAKLIPKLAEKADKFNVQIVLPDDFVAAKEFKKEAEFEIVESIENPTWMGLDIGPKSIEKFRKIIIGESERGEKDRTILWNGPMGVFEWEPFERGTKGILDAIIEATGKGTITVVGGGDSAAAVLKWNGEDKISHLSTGGGASLELLEVKEMDGELVIIGTPFPTSDRESKNKNFIPVWKQQAVDEKGHKRFHGAFEGGFSAGYHNTVGSREGWAPSAFYSSRSDPNKVKDVVDLDEIMDEEDSKDFFRRKLVPVNLKEDEIVAELLERNGLNLSEPSVDVINFDKFVPSLGSNQIKNSSAIKKSEPFTGGAWDEEDDSVDIYTRDDCISIKKGATLKPEEEGTSDFQTLFEFTNPKELYQKLEFPLPVLPPDFCPWRGEIVAPRSNSKQFRPHLSSQELIDEAEHGPSAEHKPSRPISAELAKSALAGFIPFDDNLEKKANYIRFLKACSSDSEAGFDDFKDKSPAELYEFVLSAKMFKKPSLSTFNSKFVSSGGMLQQSTLKAGLSVPTLIPKPPTDARSDKVDEKKVPDSRSLVDEVAKDISRTTLTWAPSPLLCKRFEVECPLTEPTKEAPLDQKPILQPERFPKSETNILNETNVSEIQILPRPPEDLFEAIFGKPS